MDNTFRFKLENVREDALTDVSYYQKCSYEQLMEIGVQMYLKLNQCLTDLNNLTHNTGRYIDKKAEVERWNTATLSLEGYFISYVPYWVYDLFKDRVEEALKA